jgi:hypothetical protein
LTGDCHEQPDVFYRVGPTLNPDEMKDLFAAAWGDHERRDSGPILQRSLVYVCAFRERSLVGFVNVA